MVKEVWARLRWDKHVAAYTAACDIPRHLFMKEARPKPQYLNIFYATSSKSPRRHTQSSGNVFDRLIIVRSDWRWIPVIHVTDALQHFPLLSKLVSKPRLSTDTARGGKTKTQLCVRRAAGRSTETRTVLRKKSFPLQ